MIDWLLNAVSTTLHEVGVSVLLGILRLQFYFFDAIQNNPFIILYGMFVIFLWRKLGLTDWIVTIWIVIKLFFRWCQRGVYYLRSRSKRNEDY